MTAHIIPQGDSGSLDPVQLSAKRSHPDSRQEADNRHQPGEPAAVLESLGQHGLRDHGQHGARRHTLQQRSEMMRRVRNEDIAEGRADELLWFVEHPPLYTAGTSAKRQDLISADRFPVYDTKRGGQYTYHGPGQRVVYVMLDLNKRGRDVRCFVRQLEKWVIDTLDRFNITGFIRDGRVGVWVERPDKPKTITDKIAEDKIAAIGIRLRKWVSFHGISINVDPDLEHFDGIVPCGITEFGVTSLVDLGLPVSMFDLDVALKQSFERVFESDSGQTCENTPHENSIKSI